jgi:hypothetical protein
VSCDAPKLLQSSAGAAGYAGVGTDGPSFTGQCEQEHRTAIISHAVIADRRSRSSLDRPVGDGVAVDPQVPGLPVPHRTPPPDIFCSLDYWILDLRGACVAKMKNRKLNFTLCARAEIGPHEPREPGGGPGRGGQDGRRARAYSTIQLPCSKSKRPKTQGCQERLRAQSARSARSAVGRGFRPLISKKGGPEAFELRLTGGRALV